MSNSCSINGDSPARLKIVAALVNGQILFRVARMRRYITKLMRFKSS